MIQLIIGEKGKGKTKILLDRANKAMKEANGNIVYLDKSKQHMYELNNRIRLIDVTAYPITNSDAFKTIKATVGPVKAGQASCKLTK